MLHHSKQSLLALSLLAGATLLTACGGSGGGGSTPAPSNTAPVISGDASPTVAENQTSVTGYSATDAQGDSITFSLGGADAALFSIDADGNLSFVSAPDFDNGETGPFSVTIIATDNGTGNLAGQLITQVSVSNAVDPATTAVVQTIAPDFSVSQVAFIDGQNQQVNGGFYIKDKSDYTVETWQSDIYHIGRFFIDTIDKYHADTPDSILWSFPTQDPNDSASRNPYALIFAAADKAYLLRYDSDKVWIVNPQAQQFDDFKIGELSLTDYILPGNVNGTPRPAAAAIVDGKLFIAMQRLSDLWAPGTTYVAVFDTTSDEEIETNANADDNVKGIPLVGINPLEHSVIAGAGKIYVTTRNAFGPADISMSRIEEIDPADYSVRPVLSAADIAGNNDGVIKGSVIVSAEKGYFYTSTVTFDPAFSETSAIYEFNPTTGAIVAANVADSGSEVINHLALDPSNILWVSAVNPGTPGIDLIDTASNSKVGSRLLTELNPFAIRFID